MPTNRAMEQEVAEFGSAVAALVDRWVELLKLSLASDADVFSPGHSSTAEHDLSHDIIVLETQEGLLLYAQVKSHATPLDPAGPAAQVGIWQNSLPLRLQAATPQFNSWLQSTVGSSRPTILRAFADLLQGHADSGSQRPGDRGELADLLTPSLTELNPVPPAAIEQARKVAERRISLLKGGAFTYPALAAGRRSTLPAIRQWVRRAQAKNSLFVVKHDGENIVPAFLLDEELAPRSAARPAIAALRGAGEDGWALWAWFVTPSGWLGGTTPAEKLLVEPDLVKEAAERRASNAA